MGVILSCKCQNCKYSKKGVFLGQGMIRGHYYFPCCNVKKATVEHFNYFEGMEMDEFILIKDNNGPDDKFKVKDRLPYYLKEMFKRGKDSGKTLNKSPHLQSNLNYCPKCKEYMLNFMEYGLFD